MFNIEKSVKHPGQYVGYGGGTVWEISRYGRGRQTWRAVPRDIDKHRYIYERTLADVSAELEVA